MKKKKKKKLFAGNSKILNFSEERNKGETANQIRN